MKVYSLLSFILFSIFSFIYIFSHDLMAQYAQGNEKINQLLESGFPFTTHYPTDEYNAHYQNWAIVQDNKGLMYFGNGDGILIYDGTNWELVMLPNQSSVLSLTKDQNGRVYVGAVGEMGFLKADSIGHLTYISSLSYLNKDDQNFTRVYSAYAASEGVYFQTPEALFQWTGKKFNIWKAGEHKFTRAFWVNNSLLLKVNNDGLFQLTNNQLVPLPNTNYFSDKTISTILSYNNQHLLIGTLNQGLFLYDGKNLNPFSTEVNSFLIENKLYSAISLNDSSLALGTLQGGLIIIDKAGRQRFVLNNEGKLSSPMIFSLYQDKSGIIWTALNDGIAKIEYPSPFSEFGRDTQLKGSVESLMRYQNKIYAGTDRGLYYMDIHNPESKESSIFMQPGFQLVKGANQKVWDLLQFENSILVATDEGVFQLKGNALNLINKLKTYSVLQSKLDPNRIFLGHTNGVSSLYHRNSHWENEGMIPGVYGSVHDILETSTGVLWLATNVNWIWKVIFNPDIKKSKAEKYGITKGLPDDVGHLYLLEDQLLFVCILHSDDTYRYNQASDTFRIDYTLNKIGCLGNQEAKLRVIDEMGNIWFDLKEAGEVKAKMIAWKQALGKYIVEDLQESRILNSIGRIILYEKENHIAWFGTRKGIIEHNLLIKEKQDTGFTTLVRKVIYKSDSVLFAGLKPDNSNKLFLPLLPFTENKFRFQYSALSFRSEKDNQYQYFLEGFDKDWSEWSNETQRDYTNLHEGKYIFRVRGRDIYGNISKEDEYAFIILPPWHRTWWAYLLYGFILLGGVILIVQWRSIHLKHEKEELENIVEERTHQLAGQTQQLAGQTRQLEEQAEKLRDMDQQKSRFFANISHEFRTPLTLIKGPVEQSLQTPGESLSKEDKIMIRNNTNRLLRLVNQLLDLSKLDAHSLELNPVNGDIFKFLRTIGSAFTSHADQRNISYHVYIPEDKLFVEFDHDKLEKIIYNILSNSFKFTSDGGKITFKAFMLKQPVGSNLVIVEITDNGIGISPEHQQFIYDRFYQTDNSLTREHEGSGIGLALTKELLNLMNGNIEVESQLGKGSRFTLKLPIVLQPDLGSLSVEVKELFSEDSMKLPYSSEEISKVTGDSVTTSEKYKPETPIILIVEDNTDMRGYIKKQLVNDYWILEAPNGKEGLETAKREIPDLVITDLMMPHMDGISLCKNLKTSEQTNHIPVIMLTAKAGQEQKIEGLEMGADSYLTKPFDRKELKVLIKNLISQRIQLREKYSKEVFLEPKHIPISSLDEQFLQKAMKFLEENLSDAGFGVPEMQDALAMSKIQLYRKMRAITNEAPGEFMRNYRLKRAAQILSQKGENVTQVAFAVGFNNLSYFAKCFKELHGVPPSEYFEKSRV